MNVDVQLIFITYKWEDECQRFTGNVAGQSKLFVLKRETCDLQSCIQRVDELKIVTTAYGKHLS